MTAAASFPNDTAAVFVLVDAAEARRADLECGSIALVTNSTSLNAMKFYGQVSFGPGDSRILNTDRVDL